jgi:hypothetical protein
MDETSATDVLVALAREEIVFACSTRLKRVAGGDMCGAELSAQAQRVGLSRRMRKKDRA